MMFSPITKKRLSSFRRIRRAWLALWAFVGIFIFCMLAELFCPYDPRAVIDVAELEPYRERKIDYSYEIKTVRFTILADGKIVDFEGPRDYNIDDYRMHKTVHADGSIRVFLQPKAPPKAIPSTELKEVVAPVTFPFRPIPGHPFGIDAGGRDVYARVVHGMRIALLFGLVLALLGLLVGLIIGAIEGYFGGVTDIVLQRFTEIWSTMPFLYVMIFIGSTVGRSFTILLICYAIFNWITISYYMRAEFLRLRMKPFVEAAKSQGFSAMRIIFSHILPNALTPLITLFPFLLMGAIGSLAALDFLGFGLPPMTPSCGELMQEAQQFREAWWLILFPALALFIVMMLTVLIGEGLRDAFDPRQCSRLE